MPKNSLNVSLKGADDIFSTEESRQEQQREQVQQIPIGELFPFKNHPFKVLDDESQLYEELISYADLYDSASFEAKKMIVSQLIRRVEVYRGYQIHVDFNFDLAQYLENSDELAC